jgi:hypothetical protein
MTGLSRALLWAVTSAVLLLLGLFGLGLGVARGLSSGVAGLVFRAIAQQALLPLWIAALASWLVLARVAPGVERSWGRLALGLAAIAALWFPLVGQYSFQIWQPTSARDYVLTWLLVSGGVAAALLLARRAFPALRPGAFAGGASQSGVEP